MLITLLAITMILGSVLLTMSSLRMVVHDTIEAVSLATARARKAGDLHRRLAYAALWVVIFCLSFL